MSLRLFYNLIVVLFLIIKINQTHSAGRFYTTTENKQYYVEIDKKYTWYDSLIECMKLNMTIASIESDTEQQALTTLFKSSNNFKEVPTLWLGGLMVPNTRHFIWIPTGKPFKYTKWFQGNPDFQYNCIITGWGANNEWTDLNCTYKKGYICEQSVTATDERKLQEDIEKLNENLRMEIQEQQNLQQELKKQKELTQNLQKQLQQINDTKLEMQEKIVNLQQQLQEPQQELEQELPNGEQNVRQVSQTKQDSQHLTEQNEAKQQNDDKNKSYLNLLLPNIQNAYFFQNSS